jgi:hypothetical protein
MQQFYITTNNVFAIEIIVLLLHSWYVYEPAYTSIYLHTQTCRAKYNTLLNELIRDTSTGMDPKLVLEHRVEGGGGCS